MSFVHLHIHTEYSIVDSIIRVEKLVEKVQEFQMPAVGVSDLNRIFSAVKLYSCCLEAGVKPIIGAEFLIENSNQPDSPYPFVLFCQNLEGYQSMCRLLTRAYHERKQSSQPFVRKNWLYGETDGLIALSGGLTGEIGQQLLHNDSLDTSLKILNEYRTLFPDRYYLEISRIGSQFDDLYGERLLELADSTNTPVVATNEPRFLEKEDFELHEIKMCIYDRRVVTDKNRRQDFTEQQYLRSAEEMEKEFSDIPGALANSLEIAARCNLMFDLEKSHLPAYPHPIEADSIDEHLALESRKGLEKLMPNGTPDAYKARLEQELEIIRATQFAGYFLIVADIIDWAKKEGIPVGPGRGSGAGSLVAYSLGITALDPIKYGLIFERFLNPERVSPPDFDIDFCVEQRDKVIEHVAETYGKDKVAQIITYNKMAARAAVKDVGRALKPDYMFYDQLAKLIPRDLDITLEKAKERSSEFNQRYKSEPRVKDLIDTATSLEGVVRNVSRHPGGIVIAPTEITNYVALMVESDGNQDITHFDKYDLEEIGLVKFDFLGLTTLTTISKTLQLINSKKAAGETEVTEASMSFDDKATFDYICTGKTIGIFQLESNGMQRLILQMQPKELNDLIALLALFRPGPLQTKMDQQFIKNRRNIDNINYLDPALKPILEDTYGVILYQEQVMKIAQTMSGYTMGEADILRWAMGKKVASEMKRQRQRFVDGAIEKGFSGQLAAEVYNLIQSFGEYGFNKSHSVAYAILAYRTAWLKVHYTAEFLAACMSVDMQAETIVKFIYEAKAHGITIISPDINRSNYEFKAIGDKQILYGLGGIKQIGKPVAETIASARANGDVFKDIVDFCTRVDLTKISRSSICALACSGAFDNLESNRAKIYESAHDLYNYARRQEEDRRHRQTSLFESEEGPDAFFLNDVPPWSSPELLRKEFEYLGLYMSGHPMEIYEDELKQVVDCAINKIDVDSDKTLIVGGWVSNRQISKTKKGEEIAFIDLEDSTGSLSVAFFSESYEQYKKQLEKNSVLVVVGKMSGTERTSESRFYANKAFDLSFIRNSSDVKLSLTMEQGDNSSSAVMEMKSLFEQHGGNQKIEVHYISSSGAGTIALGDEYKVQICDELLEGLRKILAEEKVSICYPKMSWLKY